MTSAPPSQVSTGALDPATAAELATRYKGLWTDYKLAVTGLYFCGAPLAGSLTQGGSGASAPSKIFAWEAAPDPSIGLAGVQASQAPPLNTFLQAPRLDPQLATYLKD